MWVMNIRKEYSFLKQCNLLELQLSLAHSGHYCLINSITSTDIADPYRNKSYPISVLSYMCSSLCRLKNIKYIDFVTVSDSMIFKEFNLFYAAHISLLSFK